jgi:hypothetical protein
MYQCINVLDQGTIIHLDCDLEVRQAQWQLNLNMQRMLLRGY